VHTKCAVFVLQPIQRACPGANEVFKVVEWASPVSIVVGVSFIITLFIIEFLVYKKEQKKEVKDVRG